MMWKWPRVAVMLVAVPVLLSACGREIGSSKANAAPSRGGGDSGGASASGPMRATGAVFVRPCTSLLDYLNPLERCGDQ